MSDLASLAQGVLTNGTDLALDAAGLGLATDGGMQTAVYISLFTDRLAEVGDVIPDGSDDRRGWWADSVAPLAPGHLIGSRLWLLHREKELASVLVRAQTYAEEALAWLLTSGAASAVTVTATNPRPGWLALDVSITRPTGGTYSYQWEWMTNALS